MQIFVPQEQCGHQAWFGESFDDESGEGCSTFDWSADSGNERAAAGNAKAPGFSLGDPLPIKLESTFDRTADSGDGAAPNVSWGNPLPTEPESTSDWTINCREGTRHFLGDFLAKRP